MIPADRTIYLQQLEQSLFDVRNDSLRAYYFLLYHHTLFKPEDQESMRTYLEGVLLKLESTVKDKAARRLFGRYIRQELKKYL